MTRRPPTRRWLAVLSAVALAFAGVVAVPMAAQASPVASTITGSVADPTDTVNTGDVVEVWEYPAGGTHFNHLTDGAVDASGDFSIPISADTDNTYAVVIDTTVSGYEPTWSDDTVFGPELTTDPGALPGAASIDFGVITMAADITVSGTVTDASGPVAGVVVLLLRVGDSSPVSGDVTDGSGNYHIPFATNTRVLIGAEVPLGGPTGYAMQFWSNAPSPGTGQSFVTAGVPFDDLPGHDFLLQPTTDVINILSTYILNGVGCGCGGFPQTEVHLYMKVGDYWTPLATDSDLGSLLSGFIELTPGDYRLRFTDPSGGWMPVDDGSLIDSNPGGYTIPAADGCYVELDGLALGDQPTLSYDLDPADPSCGDEPTPPPPATPALVIKKHRVTTTVISSPTPTPTPTPVVTSTPTPEPSVTTQTTPPIAPKPTGANLTWLWWVVGVVLLLALIGAALVIFRRRP